MKNEKILNAIGEIDDDLILDAADNTRTPARKRKLFLKWGSLAAMLILCVGIGFFSGRIFSSSRTNTPAIADSIVLLDVNPSISLTVDAGEKVVHAEGLNTDGAIILNGMNLVDVDLTVAINAIVGSMLQKGYLNDLQNAILVSVENDDTEKSAALRERISNMVGDALQNGNLEGTILSQTIHDTANLEQIAQEYHISLGKAALIQEVTALDQTLTVDKLAPLSITEIALISQSKNLTPDALTQNGAASDKAYISQNAAVEIPYNYANVNAQDVTQTKIEFDSEDGIMIYEAEFYVGTAKYECDIDARTGQVLKYETENRAATAGNPAQTSSDAQQASTSGSQQTTAQNPSGTQQTSVSYIGEEAAMEAALSDAGITADTVDYINAWIEYDDHHPEHYEVKFGTGSIHHKYEIDLCSGIVLGHEMEDYGTHHTDHKDHHDNSSSPATDIGEADAKAIALSHAQLTESQVTKLRAEYDYDDGYALYEVEFEYNGYEYEYKIDAATGAILKYEIDN